MGKFQRIKKIKRELKELKYNFFGYSLQTIKEEIAPIALAKVSYYLGHYGKVFINNNIINFFINLGRNR
jgi:hypothetical protein